MRKTLLSGSLCFLALLLGAQAVPRFQMPLYFEDAAGHRDTIVVGYDENASYDTLNPQFGEYPIYTPFDSIFEVRAAHAIDPPHTLSKKVISHYEGGGGDTCFASAGVEIFIQAKYLPITVTYDTTLVNSSYCHRNMILSPDLNIFLLQYWWDAREYYCMTHTDMVVDTFTHPGVTTGGWLTRSYEVEGQGMKELPGYFWIVKYIGICQYQVGATPPVIAGSGIDLFPNPANQKAILYLPDCDGVRVRVWNAAGQLIRDLPFVPGKTAYRLDIADWASGVYLVAAYIDEHKPTIRRLVVTH